MFPDLVKRNVDVMRPNKVWVTDCTYIRIWEGWLSLALVMDLVSRKIIGRAVASPPRRALVLHAVVKTVRLRRTKEAVIHSDKGSPFASDDLRRFCQRSLLEPSMSRRCACGNTAAAESSFTSLKKERIRKRIDVNREATIEDVRDDMDWYSNPVRRRRRLDSFSPGEFETRTKRAQRGVRGILGTPPSAPSPEPGFQSDGIAAALPESRG